MDDPSGISYPRREPVGQEAATGVYSADGVKLRELVALVRERMRDTAEINLLTSTVEHTDRQIALALADGVVDWNTTPPLLDVVTFATHPSVPLLADKAVIQLLESSALYQMRNNLSFQDGQGQIGGINDKGPQLMQWSGMFKQAYEAKKRALKQAMNLDGSINGSGVNSEYNLVNQIFS